MVTAIVVVLFTAACTHSGTGGGGTSGGGGSTVPQPVPQPVSSSPTPAAESACDQGYSPVTFVDTVTGDSVGDLAVCASQDPPDTIISNNSESTVWYVAEPADYSYWTFSNDVQNASVDATVLLFRTAMRTLNGKAPTIEPGTTVNLSVASSAIQLKQDAGEQAVWQDASLLVESAVDKSKEAVITTLEDNSSPTGSAMIACMSAGYTLGQSLTSQSESADEIQSQLTGLFQGSQECGSKISEAQEALSSEGKTPELTLNKIADETHDDPEWEDSGRLVNEAIDIGDDLLKLHG